jgi:hypothetical protein
MAWKAKYFTIEEMTASPTAKRHNIDNTPTPTVVANLQALVTNILDPLREKWGAPIIVTSAYRCTKLNFVLGGAAHSQHVIGQAADIRTVSDSPDDNMALLRCIAKANLPFDQLICEYPDAENRPNWIHISYSKYPRRMKLTCRSGKYYTGITL